MPFDLSPIATTALQHTLRAPFALAGIGVHSGQLVNIIVLPAAANAGITFVRTDVTAQDNTIPAHYANVTNASFCTVITNAQGIGVSTVEHLMAALRGAGIDNATIEIDAAEMPILDGSAAPYIAEIERIGTLAQNAPRRMIRVLRDVTVEMGDATATLAPSEDSEFEFMIDYPDTIIGQQTIGMQLVNGNFKHDIAAARTFGLLSDIEKLRGMGLALGGSLENAIVVDGAKVMNEDGLRFADEFVRHKVLDAIGDLYLAGAPIMGAYSGVRAGHALNNKLLHALFADRRNWEFAKVPAAVTA